MVTSMVGLVPIHVNVLTAQAPVVTVTSPSIGFAPFPPVATVIRLAAQVLHAKQLDSFLQLTIALSEEARNSHE